MEPERGKQADDRVWRTSGRLYKGMLLRDLSVLRDVQASADALELTRARKGGEALSGQPSFGGVARAESALLSLAA